LERCTHRLAAIDVLFERKSWADVVRESQEVVELALKALLSACNIEVPRIHDVSPILEEQKSLLPVSVRKNLSKITRISRDLRRDRELAFYGSADLTPSQFYKQDDAKKAKDNAGWVVVFIKEAVLKR